VAWLRVRSGSGRRPDDVLLLAALLFLLRCVLDPWNNVYYALPFVLTLLAWEVVRRPGIPLVTLGVTGAQWVSFELLHTAPDVTAAVYLAWVVPLAGVLTQRVFAPARAARFAEAVRRRLEHALPTLVRPRPAHVLIDGPAG
jgi:hypothetical protein